LDWTRNKTISDCGLGIADLGFNTEDRRQSWLKSECGMFAHSAAMMKFTRDQLILALILGIVILGLTIYRFHSIF
jgi:hypothetical protein